MLEGWIYYSMENFWNVDKTERKEIERKETLKKRI